MVYTINGKALTAKIKALGSELISVKDREGNEYIYQPSAIWIGQAKNLFPNVGMVKDDYMKVGDTSYPLMKHGFAKDMAFELAYEDEKKIGFVLKHSDATKKCYPYDFEFLIHFELDGQTLIQTYEVRNTGHGPMYFGVGAHTGFNSCEGSYLDFGDSRSVKEVDRIGNSFLTGESLPFPLKDGKLDLAGDLFNTGGFILENFDIKKVTAVSPGIHQKVTVEFEPFDYMTLWRETGTDDFICIEPWCALPDREDTNHRFEDKKGNVRLEAGGVFKASQKMTFERI